MLNYLTGVPWKRGTGMRFLPFIGREMGVSRNLQAVPKVHFQILFTWQEINLGKCETHVLLFTSISYERKYVSDQLMLVFYFRDHTFVVYLRTAKVYNNSVFKELTLLFLLYKSHLWTPPPPPHAFGFPIVNTPHSFRIPVQRTPLPFGNPKSRPWYTKCRYGYFLELPIDLMSLYYNNKVLGTMYNKLY